MSYIKIDNLVKKYGTGDAEFYAIQGMTFEIDQGEFIAVVGESGSGKSTLLSMMGALNTPTSGKYFVAGLDVYSLTQDQRANFRREFLGFIFQSFYLIPYLTVIQNIMLPLTTITMNRADKLDMAETALRQVSLEGKEKRLPSEISGGEQERVAIARAIVNNPTILLADEPTGNLDTKTSRGIMELFHTLNNEGMTVVMVTHSPDYSMEAGRILQVSDGLIVGEKFPLQGQAPPYEKITELEKDFLKTAAN